MSNYLQLLLYENTYKRMCAIFVVIITIDGKFSVYPAHVKNAEVKRLPSGREGFFLHCRAVELDGPRRTWWLHTDLKEWVFFLEKYTELAEKRKKGVGKLVTRELLCLELWSGLSYCYVV